MEGIPDLFHTLETVRTYFNPNLAVEGILLTMFDERTNLSKQVAEEIRKSLHAITFDTFVPRSVKLAEAPSFGKPDRPVRYPVERGGSLLESGRGDTPQMTKKALGKGLGAFIPEEFGIIKEERYAELDVDQLKPNPLQPRMKFDEKSIDELAQSIRESGVVQPVLVVQEDGQFKIIVGERRWRAAQKAGLKKIPVMIRNLPLAKQLEISIIENIHREDLNPLEIALAYQKMTQDLNYTQQEIADKVGKDRTSITNYLRLLKLPQEIQDALGGRKPVHGARPGHPGPRGARGPARGLPGDHGQGPVGSKLRKARQQAEGEAAPRPAEPGRPRPSCPSRGPAQGPRDEGPDLGKPEQGGAQDLLFLAGRPEQDIRKDQRSFAMKEKEREILDSKISGLIDQGTELKGDLTFKGSFRIEGNFKGTINSDSLLIIGERGKVEADIKVGQVVINGEIRGNVQASERVEIHSKGRVYRNDPDPEARRGGRRLPRSQLPDDGEAAPPKPGGPKAEDLNGGDGDGDHSGPLCIDAGSRGNRWPLFSENQ